MSKDLPLTTYRGIPGYLWEDIEKFLPPEEMKKFNQWFYGQTAMLTEDDKILVYQWDWDRYRAGLPVID